MANIATCFDKCVSLPPKFQFMPSQKEKNIGHLALWGCNLIWGAAAPVSKFILTGGIISSAVLADIRVLAGTVLFWLVSLCFKSGREEQVRKKDYFKLAAAAFFSTALVQVFYMKGVSLTSSVDVTICTSTLPIWTMLMSAAYLHEPVTGRKAGGVLLGFSGTLLLVLYGASLAGGIGTSLPGAVYCLLSQISYGIYLVFFQDIIRRYSPITLMKWKYAFGALMLLPFSLREFLSTEWTIVPSTQWLAIGFVIVFSTFISYFLVPFGQKYLRPTVVAMYNYLQTIAAAVIALAWGQEDFSWVKLAAVVMVFYGVHLVNRSRTARDF